MRRPTELGIRPLEPTGPSGRQRMTIRRLQPEGRLSGAVIHGDTVYLAARSPTTRAWTPRARPPTCCARLMRCWPRQAPQVRACYPVGVPSRHGRHRGDEPRLDGGYDGDLPSAGHCGGQAGRSALAVEIAAIAAVGVSVGGVAPPASRGCDLHVEAEQQDVAVLHDVVLALDPHLAGLLRARLALAGDEVVIARSFRRQ